MRKFFLIFLLSVFSNIFVTTVSADDLVSKYPTATVINPIRGPQLGLEKADLLESLKGQWQVTKQNNINATWLWQFSALEDTKLVNFAKQEMKNQEFGLFLEIDKNTAEKVGIDYRGKGPWYHSDGLFLVSYDQYERRKIIDAFFAKFKEQFGYYPKSVGAWWVGADAIEYMRKNYGVIAVLQCADQYGTDGYSLWGLPWSISYIPSKQNAAIPAQNFGDQQSNVVMMQWAPRDPVRGYGPTVKASLYSVQDMQIPEIGYYGYLVDIYLNKPFDHTIVGLEGGLPPETYTTRYASQLEYLQKIRNEKKITIQPAAVFAEAYLQQGDIFPPTHYFLTKDYENNDQSFWYHSPEYRIGIQKNGENIYLVDYRNYKQTSSEAFSILPNTNKKLYTHTKSIIDSMHNPESRVTLGTSQKPLTITEENNAVILSSDNKKIAAFSQSNAIFETISHPQNKNNHNVGINNIALFLAGILIFLYCLLLFYLTRGSKKFFYQLNCLFILLILLYPILSNGFPKLDTYMFDSRFIWMFSIGEILPLSPVLKISFIYQVIPLLILFAVHFLLFKKVKNPYLYFIFIFSMCFLLLCYYANFFQMFFALFQQGKKAFLSGIGITVLFAGFIAFLIFLYKKKKNKIVQYILLGLVSLVFLSNHKTIFAEKRLVITHFEMEALTEIAELKQDVTYLTMKPHPTIERYETIKPLVFTDEKIAEKLTGTGWNNIEIEDGKSVTLQNNDSLILVPIYQEAFIYESDMQKYKLKKIFDNIQIQLFSKNSK